jgi:hypothetical protein
VVATALRWTRDLIALNPNKPAKRVQLHGATPPYPSSVQVLPTPQVLKYYQPLKYSSLVKYYGRLKY